jgi:hypothetical protein
MGSTKVQVVFLANFRIEGKHNRISKRHFLTLILDRELLDQKTSGTMIMRWLSSTIIIH